MKILKVTLFLLIIGLTACSSDDVTAPSGGSSCNATNNCGCSNKLKADCASSCCQWVVGDGCKYR